MRITKVTTQQGDKGSSTLADGSRHAKTEPIFKALGSIDELNSHIGLLISHLAPDHSLRTPLVKIQHQLFDLGGMLSLPERTLDMRENCRFLNALIEQYNRTLPPLEEFILPGGCADAARTHVARAVCRRAERDLWTLLEDHPDRHSAAVYINRLSDVLFILARHFNQLAATPEPYWRRS